MRVTLYWTNDGLKIRDKICAFFNIPMYISINGETPCDIKENMFGKLKATEQRGLIKIRYKNGDTNI